LKVRKIGKGEPQHAVMYCVHGNEPCGKYAVERILHEGLEFRKPVKLVFANEKAYREGKSELEADLNRAWGTDSEENHEEKLARKIENELRGKKVLDLHSSFSHPEAFGIDLEKKKELELQTEKLGLDKTVNMGEVYSSRIPECERIAAECGYVRSENALRNAYRITKNFLRANGIIEGEPQKTDPEKFRIYDKVEGRGYQFTGENFKKIRKGETFAIKGKRRLRAEEDFHPVLMSTTGYDDMIGFKAEKIS
jgi:succinylglutamate desuccinylase